MKVIDFILKTISAVCALVIVAIIIILVSGHNLLYVKTSSMEPDIPQWSLIIVKRYSDKDKFYDNVEIGSDITFTTESGNYLTHRVIFLDEEILAIWF